MTNGELDSRLTERVHHALILTTKLHSSQPMVIIPLARGPLDLVTYTRSAIHSNPSAARRGQTLTLKDTSIPRPTRAAANSCVAACHSRADPSAAGENPDRVGRSDGAEWETAGKHRRLYAVCALPILNLSSGRCRPHGSPWSPLRPTVSRPQCPFDLPLRRSPPPSRLLISSLVLSPRPFPLTEYPTMSLFEGLSMSTQIFPTLHIPVTDSHSDTQESREQVDSS